VNNQSFNQSIEQLHNQSIGQLNNNQSITQSII